MLELLDSALGGSGDQVMSNSGYLSTKWFVDQMAGVVNSHRSITTVAAQCVNHQRSQEYVTEVTTLHASGCETSDVQSESTFGDRPGFRK